MKVDILYVANGRHEFTHASSAALTRNTNWGLVDGFFTCCDYGNDPASVYYEPSGFEVIYGKFGSPVEIMLKFLAMRRKGSDYDPNAYFVKIDNDFIVCPNWLDTVIFMLQRNSVDLLGIEARYGEESSKRPNEHDISTELSVASHIGGIGAMRYGAFEEYPDMQAQGLFGFNMWQNRHPDPEIKKAWLNPPLPVFLLDHLPFEPWASYSEAYLNAGIQRRQWGYYGEEYCKLWEWWEPNWKEKRRLSEGS